jgi:hypothetical protein
LTFPLRNGKYLLTNVGFSPSYIAALPAIHTAPTEKFAIDIIRPRNLPEFLGSLFKRGLEQYAIFGDDIYSPCDGFIEKANDDLPDLVPPNRGTVANHIRLNCDGTTIMLAHLMQKSIKVKEGQKVTTRDILARVGNNGISSEPHLHIAAYIMQGENMPVEPLQILFANQLAKKNSLVKYGK